MALRFVVLLPFTSCDLERSFAIWVSVQHACGRQIKKDVIQSRMLTRGNLKLLKEIMKCAGEAELNTALAGIIAEVEGSGGEDNDGEQGDADGGLEDEPAGADNDGDGRDKIIAEVEGSGGEDNDGEQGDADGGLEDEPAGPEEDGDNGDSYCGDVLHNLRRSLEEGRGEDLADIPREEV